MTWIQLRLDADPSFADSIEDALLEVGAAAVTLEDNADQPLYEPGVNERPLWQHTRVSGLFNADVDITALLQQLESLLPCPLPPWRSEILEDRDWEREWMSHYRPLRCGERLWICPSWCEPEDPTATNLLLDPGLAFGTGTHPTTFLCLQWLDSQSLQGKTVIDYGCGSGILGIAALLLGAERVIAVDNDPQALTATRANAERNGLNASRIECLLPPQLLAETRADIVVANILAGPLLELAPRLASMIPAGGLLALSGILDSQSADIQRRYSQWFQSMEVTSREHWVCISAQRQR